MHTRRRFIYMAVIAGAAVFARPLNSAAVAKKNPQPNFIVIFTDDQGYQDLGVYGAKTIKTPNIDRMAAEGMRFTDFYSAASICSPSRAALLTGCYPPRVSVNRVFWHNSTTGLHSTEQTIAEILKAKNYATMCIGKWHLGHKPDFLPTNQGFDSYYGLPLSNDMKVGPEQKLADNILMREGATLVNIRQEPLKRGWVGLMRDAEVIEFPADQSTLTRRYTEEAQKFIRSNKDRPFFLYMPHTMPHRPLAVSDAFKGKSEHGMYGDAVEEIDWSVGEILRTLRDEGLDQDTLVIFASDNGPVLTKDHSGGSALPLRGGKFQSYEGGHRVPCIMRWPAKIPAGRDCREIACTIDILPTLAGIAGARLPKNPIDGKNILPLMTGKPGAQSPHKLLCYYSGGKLEAVRMGKWKLRVTPDKQKRIRTADGKWETLTPEWIELYDLEADMGETDNLADDRPDIVKSMRRAMLDFDSKLQRRVRPLGDVAPDAS